VFNMKVAPNGLVYLLKKIIFFEGL
jgi:hypothetical protein